MGNIKHLIEKGCGNSSLYHEVGLQLADLLARSYDKS